jgi:hypothetical protein
VVINVDWMPSKPVDVLTADGPSRCVLQSHTRYTHKFLRQIDEKELVYEILGRVVEVIRHIGRNDQWVVAHDVTDSEAVMLKMMWPLLKK